MDQVRMQEGSYLKLEDKRWFKLTIDLGAGPGVFEVHPDCYLMVTFTNHAAAKDPQTHTRGYYVDNFELIPNDAVAGLFRKDLFDKVR